MIIKPEAWISKPDHDGNGLLQAWVTEGEAEFPIPIETHQVSLDDVKMDEEQNFELILECAKTPRIYKDLDAYHKDHERGSMAPESVIPVGLFSVSDDADFVQTPQILLSGKVVVTYDDPTRLGFEASDVLFSLCCLGNEYDAVMHSEFSADTEIEEGNIISCVYWVQGWPSEGKAE